MILRATTAALGLAAAAVMLSGCLAAAPEPTPTSTAAFASEDEAFAAAEETYRAYVDAINARRADAESMPEPQSFLTGEALTADIRSQQEAGRLGIRLEGTSTIVSVVDVSADSVKGDVVIRACYDSSSTRVLNEAGEDVTVPDRDPTVLTEVHLTDSGEQLLIETLLGVTSDEC
ncbi:hypothetical protein [Microbacterium sp. NPDC058389]|uniref:hypothetical protein n=1 Tax=Microbacterium sp. NPDC058389 TaxID=3346475 RepID=UPI003658B8A9